MLWRLILPLWGLSLFAFLTYHSIQWNNEFHSGRPGRYFYWSATRLDSDPLNRHPRAPLSLSCEQGVENCVGWDPESIWITSGWIYKAFLLTALPAFLVSLAIVHGLSRLGVSEVVSFMISTPLLVFAWFFFVGWLLNGWRIRRSPRKAATSV
jgi:hypothetical protein